MCLFCKIVRGEIPAEIVHETEHTLAFRDLHPAAPIHVLVVPKKHIANVSEATADDQVALGELFLAAKAVAEKEGLLPKDGGGGGYRLVVNNGPDAGQSVFHIHVHVLGGRGLSWPPG